MLINTLQAEYSDEQGAINVALMYLCEQVTELLTGRKRSNY